MSADWIWRSGNLKHAAGQDPERSSNDVYIIAAFRGEQTYMPTSFLEIVELPDGRIELRRAEDEGSLVTLDFSEDAKAFLQGQHVEIAKAMLSVGVQMAGRMVEGEFDKEEGPRVLH
ncbi:hypothetical protein J2Y39_002067 [Pseudomonas sp. 2957]|jgi:hypothetical protein|nr:hypothetical protein [Pseudomonas koreensis]MDR6947469.1 hypothetical protein [Pseudomonas sp. 2957]